MRPENLIDAVGELDSSFTASAASEMVAERKAPSRFRMVLIAAAVIAVAVGVLVTTALNLGKPGSPSAPIPTDPAAEDTSFPDETTGPVGTETETDEETDRESGTEPDASSYETEPEIVDTVGDGSENGGDFGVIPVDDGKSGLQTPSGETDKNGDHGEKQSEKSTESSKNDPTPTDPVETETDIQTETERQTETESESADDPDPGHIPGEEDVTLTDLLWNLYNRSGGPPLHIESDSGVVFSSDEVGGGSGGDNPYTWTETIGLWFIYDFSADISYPSDDSLYEARKYSRTAVTKESLCEVLIKFAEAHDLELPHVRDYPGFSDVSDNGYIEKAYVGGLVDAKSDAEFGADDPVTHDEMSISVIRVTHVDYYYLGMWP